MRKLLWIVICLLVLNLGAFVYARKEKRQEACKTSAVVFAVPPEMVQAKTEELAQQGYCLTGENVEMGDKFWKITVSPEDLPNEENDILNGK